MKCTLHVNFSPQEILARRGLGPSGRAQLRLAQSARARMDKYVPFDTGFLKNSAQISPDGRQIVYSAPYAGTQYYGNYHHSDPNRGKFWDRRMLAGEKSALISDVKAVTGGR